MNKIFENIIFLISQVAILVLAIIWYYNSKEIEALIAIIISITTICITLLFRLRNNAKANIHINKLKSKKGIAIKGKQAKDNNSTTIISNLKSGGDINVEIDHE